MIGTHLFELDCNQYRGAASADLKMEIFVQYDVEVFWDSRDKSVDMGKVTPMRVTLNIGGCDMDEMPMSEINGWLKAFILSKSENLGLEQLGITEADACQDLQGEDDERAFRAEHAAGRI